MFKLAFLKDLFKLMGPNVRRHLYTSIVVGLLLFCLETFSIIVLQGFLISLGVLNQEQALIPSWYPTDVTNASLILIGLGLFRAFVIYVRNLSRSVSGNLFLKEQRSRLFRYGMAFAHVESTQSIVTLFSETIYKSSSFVSTLSHIIVSLVASSLLFLACLKLAPLETFFGLMTVGVLFIPINLLTKNVGALGKKSSDEMLLVSGTLVSSFKNYFFLKLSNMIGDSQNQMDIHLEEYASLNNKFASTAAIKSSLPSFIGTVVVAGITLASFKYFNTSSSVLLSFFFLFTRAGTNFSEINAAFADSKFYFPYVEKIIELMNKINHFEDGFKNIDGIKQAHDWEFQSLALENVEFGYSDDDIVFNNLNFKLSKGEILLIKGESGVGKSTLVSLILGINHPRSGHIKLNGIEDRTLLEKVSSVVGYVGPEPYLINASVRKNLLYGVSKTSVSNYKDNHIWEALEQAQIQTLVYGFANMLDEVLNEHVQISSGQKQRLSIARALLKKPQVLVLDEATANLDKITEEKIIEHLIKLSRAGTAIVLISHKESFDTIADKVIFMEKGIQPVFDINPNKQNIHVH